MENWSGSNGSECWFGFKLIEDMKLSKFIRLIYRVLRDRCLIDIIIKGLSGISIDNRLIIKSFLYRNRFGKIWVGNGDNLIHQLGNWAWIIVFYEETIREKPLIHSQSLSSLRGLATSTCKPRPPRHWPRPLSIAHPHSFTLFPSTKLKSVFVSLLGIISGFPNPLDLIIEFLIWFPNLRLYGIT